VFQPASALGKLVRHPVLLVNSFHREAIVRIESPVTSSARAADGVIEAIEISGQSFALGLQWHQERRPERIIPETRSSPALLRLARNAGLRPPAPRRC
jgi:gamma-glutamyl-gamma-aminobutyrate hydrolase PuuD